MLEFTSWTDSMVSVCFRDEPIRKEHAIIYGESSRDEWPVFKLTYSPQDLPYVLKICDEMIRTGYLPRIHITYGGQRSNIWIMMDLNTTKDFLGLIDSEYGHRFKNIKDQTVNLSVSCSFDWPNNIVDDMLRVFRKRERFVIDVCGSAVIKNSEPRRLWGEKIDYSASQELEPCKH